MIAKARGEAFVARAPGKLMLAGEYAVLRPQGGRALAVALPEGVEVTARPSPGGWELAREEGGLVWREAIGQQGEPPPEALRFVHAALQSSRRSPAIAQLAPLRLGTRQLGALGTGAQKPGVGGSASATVATCAVLAAAAGETCPPEMLLERALAAHREAQGGRGSGYDVATIIYGGLVDYQRLDEREAKVERRRWPASFSIVAGYSGDSASTRALLVRVDAVASAHPAAFAAELAALGEPVGELSRALVDAAPTAIADAVRDCHARLAAWDRKHALGIVTPAIEALLELARAVDVPCKIAGGGGGDSVVALHDDPQRLARLRQRWHDAGFAAFDPMVCPEGVRAFPAAAS